MPRQALLLATTAQSLVLQSPESWRVLREEGFELTFAAAADAWCDRLSEWGAFVPLRGSRRALDRKHALFVRDVRRLMKSQHWDLVQLQSPIASTLARLVPEFSGVADTSIYVAHGFHFHRDQALWKNRVVRRWERMLASRVDAVAVVAGEDYEDAGKAGFADRTLLWHLPGAGVEGAGQSRPRPQEPPVPVDPEVISAVFVGELIPRKNPLLAVEAISALVSSGVRAELTLIGDGPLRNEVLEAAQPLGSAFTYIQQTNDVPAFMREATVHILPSWQEGLPRVIMEAAALGVPSLATSNRGSRELAALGCAELMARGATAEEWAARLRCMDRRPLSAEVAAKLGRYSTESFAKSYRGLLLELGVIQASADSV